MLSVSSDNRVEEGGVSGVTGGGGQGFIPVHCIISIQVLRQDCCC